MSPKSLSQFVNKCDVIHTRNMAFSEVIAEQCQFTLSCNAVTHTHIYMYVIVCIIHVVDLLAVIYLFERILTLNGKWKKLNNFILQSITTIVILLQVL